MCSVGKGMSKLPIRAISDTNICPIVRQEAILHHPYLLTGGSYYTPPAVIDQILCSPS